MVICHPLLSVFMSFWISTSLRPLTSPWATQSFLLGEPVRAAVPALIGGASNEAGKFLLSLRELGGPSASHNMAMRVYGRIGATQRA